jgi:hypothetical protein
MSCRARERVVVGVAVDDVGAETAVAVVDAGGAVRGIQRLPIRFSAGVPAF